jgi:hypothetical protein
LDSIFIINQINNISTIIDIQHLSGKAKELGQQKNKLPVNSKKESPFFAIAIAI